VELAASLLAVRDACVKLLHSVSIADDAKRRMEISLSSALPANALAAE